MAVLRRVFPAPEVDAVGVHERFVPGLGLRLLHHLECQRVALRDDLRSLGRDQRPHRDRFVEFLIVFGDLFRIVLVVRFQRRVGGRAEEFRVAPRGEDVPFRVLAGVHRQDDPFLDLRVVPLADVGVVHGLLLEGEVQRFQDAVVPREGDDRLDFERIGDGASGLPVRSARLALHLHVFRVDLRVGRLRRLRDVVLRREHPVQDRVAVVHEPVQFLLLDDGGVQHHLDEPLAAPEGQQPFQDLLELDPGHALVRDESLVAAVREIGVVVVAHDRGDRLALRGLARREAVSQRQGAGEVVPDGGVRVQPARPVREQRSQQRVRPRDAFRADQVHRLLAVHALGAAVEGVGHLLDARLDVRAPAHARAERAEDHHSEQHQDDDDERDAAVFPEDVLEFLAGGRVGAVEVVDLLPVVPAQILAVAVLRGGALHLLVFPVLLPHDARSPVQKWRNLARGVASVTSRPGRRAGEKKADPAADGPRRPE